MKIIKRVDKYNPNKVWVIKHTKCGHFYINQEICGKLFYKAFQRTTFKHIQDIVY